MPTWNIAQLLLFMMLLQHAVASVIWLLTVKARIAPRVPGLHWAAASAWTGVVMALALLQPWIGTTYGHDLAVLLSPGIFILVRLGIHILFRTPRQDVEHFGVIAVALACGLGGMLLDAPSQWPIVYSALLSAFSLWRCASCVQVAAEKELGAGSARFVLLPLRLMAMVFMVRAASALIASDTLGVPLSIASPSNVVVLALFFTASIVFHLILGMTVALRLVARLKNLSQRDPLTGLLNRRGLQEQRLVGAGGSVALVALDVDHFKRINDTYGHAIGDRALQHLAELVRRTLRSSDLAARVGGEEFVLLMPGVDQEQALQTAERLRVCIASQPLRLTDLKLPMTVSLGVACGRSEDDCDLLIARADEALYRAKAAGRNRIELAR
ncbi:MAG: GGDEF domain-containing protein [Burkholderiales bacterium]